ncbi:SH3 and multiple ankyrin repeat domains protein 3-like [Patagioenas fasciata monilis]|uniref:SH3 and multiple ankyrin repeat domains protein 3-like n=1 Tax=Patagioenas fasciata monilis TaxID=372326 RepID=A0A1V4K4R4_PATFA|nr:SH3 and multiple ankyrin repeat domains protein 3-like [Patagioenas fasciata monilis]
MLVVPLSNPDPCGVAGGTGGVSLRFVILALVFPALVSLALTSPAPLPRPPQDISLEEFDDEDLSEITDDCGIGLNYDSDHYEKDCLVLERGEQPHPVCTFQDDFQEFEMIDDNEEEEEEEEEEGNELEAPPSPSASPIPSPALEETQKHRPTTLNLTAPGTQDSLNNNGGFAPAHRTTWQDALLHSSSSSPSHTGELSTISQRSSGTTYTVRPGSRYPVTRRTPSPVKPALDRTEPLSTVRPYGLTPPTILKSSSLSIPHEPKEVRFVVRSVSARSRSPSPSPSPGPPLHTLHPPRPFMQKPLHLWNKYDVGDWLESINLVEHRDKFEDHEIEGTHLPALTKEDFVELGVTRVGHRMNIERALKQLVDS